MFLLMFLGDSVLPAGSGSVELSRQRGTDEVVVGLPRFFLVSFGGPGAGGRGRLRGCERMPRRSRVVRTPDPRPLVAS